MSNTEEPNTPAPADRPAPEPAGQQARPTIRVGGIEITADWPAPLSPDRFPLNLVRPPEFGDLEVEARPKGGEVSKSKSASERTELESGNGSPSKGNLPDPNSRSPRLPRVLASEELVRLAHQKLEASGESQRWGLHIQAGAVTLFVGQTSAGKTTFLHNLAYHLAEGREFLGITPPRPLRVLYADYESTYAVLEEHGKKIGVSKNLAFLHPEELPKGKVLIAALRALIERDRYDVVIVDPLIKAFPVQDENDNAEASAQMDNFKDLARRTGVAVVLVHNSGQGKEQEAPEDDPFYGRGASARADSADVGISFRRSGGRRRFLKVAKSRYKNYGDRIDAEFSGELGYRLSPAEAASAKPGSRDLVAEAIRVVQAEHQVGRIPAARRTIQARLGIQADSAEDRGLTEALKEAVDTQRLSKPKHGYYDLPSADARPAEEACAGEDEAIDDDQIEGAEEGPGAPVAGASPEATEADQ